MIPNVPSAPINSFVVSHPAEDLRERRRVLITLPLGRTTVCIRPRMISRVQTNGTRERSTHKIQEPLALGGTITNGIRCDILWISMHDN